MTAHADAFASNLLSPARGTRPRLAGAAAPDG
jgi:hypothetical protein